MAYRVLINGACGRMGRLADEVIGAMSGFEVVARCGRQHDLAREIDTHKADVVIDFTSAHCVYQNAVTIMTSGARPIIGTSGLRESQFQELKALAKEKNTSGIVVPNFSIAAVLMVRFAKMAAPFFELAEVIEMHHDKKADAPSGTAIRTAELLKPRKSCIAMNTAARGEEINNIAVHSIRMPGIMARQQVILGNMGETLNIEYNTIDRKAYAAGIELACQKVMHLTQLEFGLEQLMEF